MTGDTVGVVGLLAVALACSKVDVAVAATATCSSRHFGPVAPIGRQLDIGVVVTGLAAVKRIQPQVLVLGVNKDIELFSFTNPTRSVASGTIVDVRIATVMFDVGQVTVTGITAISTHQHAAVCGST